MRCAAGLFGETHRVLAREAARRLVASASAAVAAVARTFLQILEWLKREVTPPTMQQRLLLLLGAGAAGDGTAV